MSLPEYLLAALMLLGALFMLTAALGIVRMPDLYTRMSATSKAATLGVGSLLIAALLYFNAPGLSARLIAALLFLFITSPISAHMLARAAYRTGEELWPGSRINEMPIDAQGSRTDDESASLD